jgi:carboxyl-terminal processing protease
MEAVAQIADELISGKDTLFYTLDKKGREAIMAGNPGLYESGPLSIIIDEESASASEILAGVVQDYDRGRIYGSRSFGKGLVQEQFDLPNGDAIRITTARYYLPSGRFIQRPYNALSHADYFEQTTQTAIDTTKYPASYTLRLHRKVWSGNGIEPDIPVRSYAHIEDYPDNPFIRKAVYTLYYQQPNTLTNYRTLQSMKASATLPEAWKKAVLQIPQHIPDSMYVWRSTQKAYLENLAMAEWANIHFGLNGHIAYSWPHDAALRAAHNGFNEPLSIRSAK